MNKYDWSNVPKEVKWIATDMDGWWSTHEKEPKIIPCTNNWIDETETGYVATFPSSPFKGTWQDSLEERPND